MTAIRALLRAATQIGAFFLCAGALVAEDLEPLGPSDFPPLPALRAEQVAHLKSLVRALPGLAVDGARAREIKRSLQEFHPIDPRTGRQATGIKITGGGITWIAPLRGGYSLRAELAPPSVVRARYLSVELFHQQTKVLERQWRPRLKPPWLRRLPAMPRQPDAA